MFQVLRNNIIKFFDKKRPLILFTLAFWYVTIFIIKLVKIFCNGVKIYLKSLQTNSVLKRRQWSHVFQSIHRFVNFPGFVWTDVWTASSPRRPRRDSASSHHAAVSFRSSARPPSGQNGGWRPTAVRGFDD